MPMAPRDIVILKPSSLGDVVHTLPSVALLKRHWPQSRIRWVINSEWAPLLDGNPNVDEVIEFPRKTFRGAGGLLRIPRWARALRKRVNAELILDFQGLLRSGLISRLCRGADGQVVGLSDAREAAGFFYDRIVPVSPGAHAVDRYLALVASLGIAIDRPLEWPLPEGKIIPAIGGADYVLFHPFSRGVGKSLSGEEAAEFCQAMAPTPVILAGQADVAVASAPNVTDLLNRTSLLELIWLIRHAAFVVSVDSGPMHIAAALTSRLLSIHTWSEPKQVGPYNSEAWVYKDREITRARERKDSVGSSARVDIPQIAGFVRARLEE